METKDLENYRPLFLRANRALGSALVEHKLVTSEQLDAANGKLLELMKNGEFKQASLLNLLLMMENGPKENAIVQYQIDTHELGLINLTNYHLERSVEATVDVAACWATRTLPYERQEEFVFLATNFYLSEAVQKFWQDIYKDYKLVWSVATSANLAEALERMDARQRKPASI